MSDGFFFAMVDSSETTFTDAHKREDADVLHIEIGHDEGDFPSAAVTIRNPYEGLLSGHRKRWCWIAKNNNGNAEPIFFGRLVAPPNDTEAEAITIQYIAKSRRWLTLKQAAAEELKKPPYYDAVFISPDLRDDPNSVLQAYSAVFHFDRVPTGSPADLQVKTSDILNPEDGTLVFEESDVFYENWKYQVGQRPLTRSKMRARVHWTQQAAGTLSFGSNSIDCWTGGSLIDGWPKSGTQLSGGWIVAAGTALDGGAQFGTAQPHSLNWENREREHNNGDPMTINQRWTTYPCGGALIRYNMSRNGGMVDLGLAEIYDQQGQFVGIGDDPNTTANIPLHVSWSELLVCSWNVQTTLALDYEAARPRTERLEFTLESDLQPVTADGEDPASVDTETVTLSGADVGEPIDNVLSWYTLLQRGLPVELGQVVVSTPEFLGGPIYSRCVVPGTVGATEPNWPDVLGDTVVDGGVTWAMIGLSLPTDYPIWRDVANSQVTLGTVIKAQYFLSTPLDITGVPLPAPPAGIQSFQICTQAGTTSPYTTKTFTGLADTNPQWPEPNFSATPGASTSDGSAVWTSLGSGGNVMEIPLGLNSAARSYFSTDRGQISIKYLLGYVRARLLARSRLVEVSFECKFEKAQQLSCRMGILLKDHRLPGGQMYGKVTSYSLIADGDGAELLGRVTIKASAGYGLESSIEVAGVPEYADDYDDGTWQEYDGEVLQVSSNDNDVGYTRPLDAPNDDGVIFPITDKSLVVVKEAFITGRPPGAPEYLPNATYRIQSTSTDGRTGRVTQMTATIRVPNGFAPVQIQQQATNQWGIISTLTTLLFYPITQYYLELKPMTGVSFTTQYNIKTTKLSIPQMIDLAAAAAA